MERWLIACTLVASLALPVAAVAEVQNQTCTIIRLEKRVEVQKPGGPWTTATRDMQLAVNDQIHTGFKATAVLKFADGSEVTVKPMTMIRLQRVEQNGNTVSTRVLLRLGEIKASVNDSPNLGSDFQVQTATCTASVRGTRIDSLAYSPALGTTCQMGSAGKIQLRTLVGSVVLGATHSGSAGTAGDAPLSADGTRVAAERTPPAAAFTKAENAAIDGLGVPKSGTFTSAGSGVASGAVNTSVEATADILAINAANETVTGVDVNKDGLVETIDAGTRLRSPPFVTLPTIPGVDTNCCPTPGAPVPAAPPPVVDAPDHNTGVGGATTQAIAR